MAEPGFEITFPDETEATFVPFMVGMSASKDLKLIDRCTAMPLDEFAEAFDDPAQRGRGSIMLAVIALSIRAKFPDWSVERIMRFVDDLEMPDVTFVGGEEEPQGDPLPEEQTENDGSVSFGSPSGGSSSSATPADPSESETSKPTPD